MTDDTQSVDLHAVAILIRNISTDIDYAGDALYDAFNSDYAAGIVGEASKIRYLVMGLLDELDKIDPTKRP